MTSFVLSHKMSSGVIKWQFMVSCQVQQCCDFLPPVKSKAAAKSPLDSELGAEERVQEHKL